MKTHIRTVCGSFVSPSSVDDLSTFIAECFRGQFNPCEAVGACEMECYTADSPSGAAVLREAAIYFHSLSKKTTLTFR